jgi:hypothetical protein
VTEDEVRKLLVVAMSYDNRKMPGQANVMAWCEAATRGRWTFTSALDAVHAHYSEDTAFLMPGHVTARIRKARALQPAVQRLAIEAPPAEPERIRSIIGGLAKMLGWQKAAPSTAESLPVQCPHCHSLPGKPCVRVIGRGHRRGQHVPIQNPHQSRVDLVKEL